MRNVEHEWDRLNLEWPLTQESIVVEVGSYRGRWARQIAERYHSQLYCFEPQLWAANVTGMILDGFNAQVLNVALGTKTGRAYLTNYETDGAAIANEGHAVDMLEIGMVFKRLGIKHIDLMLMNIEGYEAKLLPHMFKKKILPVHLVIQCHGKDMRPLIARRYDNLWDYGMKLSAWKLKA